MVRAGHEKYNIDISSIYNPVGYVPQPLSQAKVVGVQAPTKLYTQKQMRMDLPKKFVAVGHLKSGAHSSRRVLVSYDSSIKTSIETKDEPIFKIDYIVYPHNSASLMRIIPDYISNWSNVAGIEAMIMTNDPTNNTKFLIRDNKNLHWNISKKLSNSNFQLIRLPFVEFKNFENKPDAKIDLSRIKFLSIIIECPENIDKSYGSVFIKQLRLY